jgi:wyosine [tRNA(Phe)-imidazoG37] synthetase (radical SAM superfamily)
MSKYKYLFGPVQSRRLGVSLGVDMVPFKTCTLDCIYCECGATDKLTCERREYVSADELINELDDYLSKKPELDYITFAGSGEPTLNTAIKTVHTYIKQQYPLYKTALLTNGTLLYLPEVRDEVVLFDLVSPSLDAISDRAFKKMNRPEKRLINDQIIQGLIEFSKMYKGILWVEVFIVAGINDSSEELALFKYALEQIHPTRIQLNSLDRPGTCEWVQPATAQELQSIASFFKPLPVEIISRHGAIKAVGKSEEDILETIVSLLRRRPSTMEELSVLTGTTINSIRHDIDILVNQNVIESYVVNNHSFFKVKAKN